MLPAILSAPFRAAVILKHNRSQLRTDERAKPWCARSIASLRPHRMAAICRRSVLLACIRCVRRFGCIKASSLLGCSLAACFVASIPCASVSLLLSAANCVVHPKPQLTVLLARRVVVLALFCVLLAWMSNIVKYPQMIRSAFVLLLSLIARFASFPAAAALFANSASFLSLWCLCWARHVNPHFVSHYSVFLAFFGVTFLVTMSMFYRLVSQACCDILAVSGFVASVWFVLRV
jgi:hypothetical protein